jgi:hypothetical protein
MALPRRTVAREADDPVDIRRNRHVQRGLDSPPERTDSRLAKGQPPAVAPEVATAEDHRSCWCKKSYVRLCARAAAAAL